MTGRNLVAVVIDDDSRREDEYRLFFEAYNNSREASYKISMKFCSGGDIADREIAMLREPFFVILDMVLEGWPSKLSRAVEERLKKVQPPLFALSGKFNEAEATSTYLRTVSLMGNTYIPMLHWDSVKLAAKPMPPHDTAAPSGSLAAAIVLSSFSIDLRAIMKADWLPSKGADSSLRILHLSDLHFSHDSPARNRYLFQIGMRLKEEGLLVDLICVTGDSVDKGGLGGYESASRWIRGLFENEWLDLPEDVKGYIPNRVFICPGNHDFNESLAVSGHVVRSNSTASGFEFSDTAPHLNSETSSAFWNFGIAPFLRYHEDLTGWRVPHGEFPGFRVVSSYSSAGLHIVELWGESYHCGKYVSPLTDTWYDDILSRMTKELMECAKQDDCVLLLIHRFSPEGGDSRYKMLRDHLIAIGTKFRVLVLSGHYHEDEVAPIPGCDTVLRIQGASMDERTRPEDQLAKFGIVSFNRHSGAVTSCRVDRIERRGSGDGWTRAGTVDHFKWTSRGWRKE